MEGFVFQEVFLVKVGFSADSLCGFPGFLFIRVIEGCDLDVGQRLQCFQAS